MTVVMNVHAMALLVATLASGMSRQEGAWPAARSCHVMSYSPRLAGVVMFGGARLCGRDVLADSALWLWQGTTWRRVNASFPGTREDALLGFDDRHGVVTLFGGRNAATVHADTWVLDGANWRHAATTGPGRLEHAAAAFDSARGVMVLFGGGIRGGAWPTRTWEWDGAQWAQRDSTGPPPRVGHSMTATRGGGVLMYGGFNEAGQFRDLWRWDGRRWALLDSGGPALSEGPALLRLTGDTIALVAAQTPEASPNPRYRVWLWLSNRWIERGEPGPAARVGHGLAFDPQRRRIVLFGGAAEGAGQSFDDVWEFDGNAWRRIR